MKNLKHQGTNSKLQTPSIREHQPYIPASQNPWEFTVKATVTGILFGIIFGAANAYLGLRAGLTISTSIPVAVMTVAAFKTLAALGGKNTILESNLSQTIGSASSSVASGVIFTIPALFLWGFDPTLIQMTSLAMLGGLLGVLFMIPLRAFLIEREHGSLPYPEGTACAQVLMASEAGGGRARNVFVGLGAGALFKFLSGWIRIFPGEVEFRIPFLTKGQLGLDMSAALFGVGYILGPRIAAIMVGGGLLSWLIIIPAIAFWGSNRGTPLYPETLVTIPEMSPAQIWSRYVRYIGAGAVATGGLITLIRSVPTMIASFRMGASQLRPALFQRRLTDAEAPVIPRTSRDLPLGFVLAGALLIASAIALNPWVFGPFLGWGGRAGAALLVVIFAFFFVTVSSRIVGLVGVTSNPTSGMTIATLLGTSAVFLMMGWTGDLGKAGALTVGAIVAVAASIAGDTSQDLKTGYLVGATPRRQQIGEIIGVLSSATFVCMAVLLLNQAYGFGGQELPAPQATLMKLVIDGVLQASLPWVLVGIGVVIALIAELLRIPSLPFAVGVYLPVSTMATVFLGGLLRIGMERSSGSLDEASSRRERGVLFGSGLVGGEGLMGVGIAAVAFSAGAAPEGIGYAWAGPLAPWLALLAFGLLALVFARSCVKSA